MSPGKRDLTGRQFGELTAIAPTDKRIAGSIVWRCKCSCGATCEVSQNSLVTGNTRSCGHKRVRDLTGQRFGRLVAVKLMQVRTNGQPGSRTWLCRCDCGSVTIVPSAYLVNGMKLSCGCIRRKLGRGYAICPACGEPFAINTGGGPTPQFCPSCAPKYAGRSWKVCPVCRALFPSPKSDKTVTCSKACSVEWKRRTHDGVANTWSEEARTRKRADGQTDNLKLGTAAAMASPVAGRFETNQEAKIWHLVTPTGEELVVRNLTMWARENAELFGKPPGDKSAVQIVHGFYAIAQTLRGKRKYPAMTYFGWTLKDVPEVPET